MDSLYIIMPAYNESANIKTVIREWYPIIEKVGGKSRLVIIDDESTDDTYQILMEQAEKYPLLIPQTKSGGGHGDTVLYGYRYALSKGADYIFQTDSDGQTRPEEFDAFWKERHQYDAIIGYRKHRQDGVSRVFVTKILRLTVFLFLGQWVTDANTPYRLMKRQPLEKYLRIIPEHYNLPNVVLSTAYVRYSKKNIKFVPITFRERQGGINSINLKKIWKIGWRAITDFRTIRERMDDFEKEER